MNYVIIGNGVAGVHAAETLRQLDAQSSITLIADEAFPPYCRPMISLVLDGSIAPEKLPIRRSRFYDDLNISAVLGDRVTGIDVDRKFVSIGNQSKINFDKLLIASGADPRPIQAEGLDLKNIFYMRTESHVRHMLKILPDAKSALVLGGGLVGFKAAYGLLRRGLGVTMLIRSAYPLSMQADETAGKMILDELLTHGLDVRVGVTVDGFHGNGAVQGAHLSDGSRTPCDLVVIGKGVLPALSFVPRDRIEVDLGITVDSFMASSVPDVYAAGDVAESVDIARGSRWVNAIWPEAVIQGRMAGMNMAGRAVAYTGSLSRNVMRIFSLDVMTAGVVNPAADGLHHVIRFSDPDRRIYRKLVFSGERLVGAVFVNQVEQGGVLVALIRNRTPITIPRRKLLDPAFNLKQLLG